MTHRADLESADKRMAFSMLETWPCLGREECFMDELAFVAFEGKKTVTDMQFEAKTKLMVMKGLVTAFATDVRKMNK